MSLAGGSLVMVGVMRSSVPVTFSVTSYGPPSVSDAPNPETVPSMRDVEERIDAERILERDRAAHDAVVDALDAHACRLRRA